MFVLDLYLICYARVFPSDLCLMGCVVIFSPDLKSVCDVLYLVFFVSRDISLSLLYFGSYYFLLYH